MSSPSSTPRRRGRPPIYANPTERERKKKRRQRSRSMGRLRRSVGLDKLAATRYEFEHPAISHVSLEEALSDPEIGPEIGPAITEAARIQRELEAARGPMEFTRTVERCGGRKRVSRALGAATRELEELNAAFTAAPCPKCSDALILEDCISFVAGDAVFVTCPHCATACYFGAAVAIPLEQRRELGTLISATEDGEPPALALSRAAGILRSVDERGFLGSGGNRAADLAYKKRIERVVGHSISWESYNKHYRPRKAK